MSREIKFRVWDKNSKQMIVEGGFIRLDGNGLFEVFIESSGEWESNGKDWGDLTLMQYTGLKDKNDLTYIYESDIINNIGEVIGNKYENENLLKEKSNLLIEGFGTKNWLPTYKKAVEYGCKDAE